ncbi:MAG: VOC family protein [Homoserinimonas sp.]
MPTRETAPSGAPCWIDLSSSDTERARQFYAELFDWTYEVSSAEYGEYINCFRNGSQVAGIMQNSPASGTADGWITYFATADAQATANLADESGGQSAVAPMEVGSMGTMAMLVDPGGATVGVWQAGQHSGFQLVGETGTPVWHELHTLHFRASVLFYETVFDWKTSSQGDTVEFRYSTADFDGVSLAGIMEATNLLAEGSPASWQVYFGVDDVDQTLALAESLGGTVIDGADDSPYGRLATLADPTGARFKIMAPAE